MSPIKFSEEVCKLFGIDPMITTSVTLRLEAGKFPTLITESHISPGDKDDQFVDQLEEVFKQHVVITLDEYQTLVKMNAYKIEYGPLAKLEAYAGLNKGLFALQVMGKKGVSMPLISVSGPTVAKCVDAAADCIDGSLKFKEG